MAGHSKFKNIMHRKEAQDAKRAKRFTKILKELTVAAKEGGADPTTNPRLRHALVQARQLNVPKANIERATKKSSDDKTYEALRYEAMGPGNVAFIIEVLTDNRNRSACSVRTAVQKAGGHMTNAAFLFDQVGCIRYDAPYAESLIDTAIDKGAIDLQESDDSVCIFCAKDDFFAVQESLSNAFQDPAYAELVWHPKTIQDVSDDDCAKAERLIAAIEDIDDVQNIWNNANILCPYAPQASDEDSV
jgi:YebC/PmpR family DNA-binding regulatory protein